MTLRKRRCLKGVETIQAVKIFYCYAHEDQKLRDALECHLEPLKRSGQIISWHDRQIQPGTEWKHEIEVHLATSDIILVLVSPSFMRSDYCYGIEMQFALQRHRSQEAWVIPIILRPTAWKETPLGELQALPSQGKPVTTWQRRDDAFQDVTEGIRQVVLSIQKKRENIFLPNFEAANTFYIKAEKLYELEFYQDALTAYQQAIYLEPNNPRFYVGMAYTFLILKLYKEAFMACERAIILNSNEPNAYGVKGYVLARLGKHEEAKQAIAKQKELTHKQWEEEARRFGLSFEPLEVINSTPLEGVSSPSQKQIIKLPQKQHITYQLQYRKCGKASCKTCSNGPGHGPYWYAYWREGSRLRSGYIGKTPPKFSPSAHQLDLNFDE